MKGFKTPEEFAQAPGIIQHVYVCAINGIPMGASTYREAMEKHPEYFEDEIAHNKIWNTIPDSVKDQYYEELDRATSEIIKSETPKKEVFDLTNPFEEAVRIMEERERLSAEQNKMFENKKRELHQKYFGSYGLSY
jgi:hypothetical protein